MGELSGDLEDFFQDKLIQKDDCLELFDLINKTDYMMDRYIDSLYKLEKEGKWKIRFKKFS